MADKSEVLEAVLKEAVDLVIDLLEILKLFICRGVDVCFRCLFLVF